MSSRLFEQFSSECHCCKCRHVLTQAESQDWHIDPTSTSADIYQHHRWNIQHTTPALHLEIEISALLITLIGLKMSISIQEAFWASRQRDSRLEENVFFIWISQVTLKSFKTKLDKLLHTNTLKSKYTNEVHVLLQALLSWFTYMRLQDVMWKVTAKTLAKPLVLINLGEKKKTEWKRKDFITFFTN